MASPRRAIRVANCSGAAVDPGDIMYAQAVAGPIDVITGDYLAEANLAQHAEAYARGEHPGWMPTAWDGLQKSLAVVAERGIKVVINGGALNPRGLAEKTAAEARRLGLGDRLRVAWVEGDDLLPEARDVLRPGPDGRLPHLDAANPAVRLAADAGRFLDDPDRKIVAANAYLGCRAIRAGLDAGADIIICGRVADASPVIGAAAWWHGWADDDWDALAGALVAGHLIECSFYVTGGNYAGFDEHGLDELLDLGSGIAEIAADGTCVVTKHEGLGGLVTEETVKCQLLYELQGNIYLHSDVKADLARVAVAAAGPNRVRVWGATGRPPPPTTKLAVFYHGGFQAEHTVNATGYATARKYDLFEAQVRRQLQHWRLGPPAVEVLEFQRVGVPEANPRRQLRATTALRLFVQAPRADTVRRVAAAWLYNFMQHFPGLAGSLDWRLLTPLPFLGYFPALVPQDRLREAVIFEGEGEGEGGGGVGRRLEVGPPHATEPLAPRLDYDPAGPTDLAGFGPTRTVPLGDVLLARSGDKGANVNVGFTPRAHLNRDETWQWLRRALTRDCLRRLVGDDWDDEAFHVERVEFPALRAVHFVVYGALGRGVSSSARLDCLGKGFAEYLRAVHFPVPERFLVRKSGCSRL